MRAVFLYLKGHFKTAVMVCLFFAVSALVTVLYGLPLEPVIYAAVLCGAVLVIFCAVDYAHYRRKISLLKSIQSNITVSTDELTEPKGEIEAAYQELVRLLNHEIRRLTSESTLRLSEMTEYYTLWAHQIKTPISAMSLLLQSQEEPSREELSAALFKIEHYVDMAIAFLRSDNISGDLLIQEYSLDAIVKQAVRKYAREFIRRKITLDYKEIDQTVITDEKWLCFVIEQLLSNALKYTREGKISIYMDEKTPCTLVIEDTGIGIQPEDIPRVFEKGFTGYNGRTDKKSTGIGLYLCKRIISKLGHGISIESQVGAGTRLLLDLNRQPLTVE
jgi:signal transduction histidine kinase